MANKSQFVVCYSLGTGAGFDTQLAGFSRQICEDFAECLALNPDFIAVPQMILVSENAELHYEVSQNACAFAVFYSLPEMRWITSSSRAIGADIALTGRIVDDETGILLSINMIDVRNNLVLFCGYESSPRDEIHIAVATLAARALAHFTPQSQSEWIGDVWSMLGTKSFHAYANWMSLREIERRSQREGIAPPTSRLVEHACYALAADACYERAAHKLCEVLARSVTTQSCDFVVRNLGNVAHMLPSSSLAYAQCLARVNRRDDAISFLTQAIERYPQEPLFPLMRACLSTDTAQMKGDLNTARNHFGTSFDKMKSLVESSLLNVTGV